MISRYDTIIILKYSIANCREPERNGKYKLIENKERSVYPDKGGHRNQRDVAVSDAIPGPSVESFHIAGQLQPLSHRTNTHKSIELTGHSSGWTVKFGRIHRRDQVKQEQIERLLQDAQCDECPVEWSHRFRDQCHQHIGVL